MANTHDLISRMHEGTTRSSLSNPHSHLELFQMEETELTPETILAFAQGAREWGYLELADTLESAADKIARFNETSPHTLEELRQKFGSETLLALLTQNE